MIRALAALCALGAVLTGPAPCLAQDPAPGSPEWHAREAQNFADASGRAVDWAASPDAPAPGTADPRRAIDRWNHARGAVIPIAYRNRYQARIVGHLWRPKAATGPLPAVVFVNGYGETDETYNWAAEDLAEHGYLVMTFNPQGDGGSDAKPAPQYCRPGGAWTQPQEMGIREQGSCAGQDPPVVLTGQGTSATFVVTGRVGDEDVSGADPVYRALAPRYVLGALDAVAFLLSGRNPWRASVDPEQVGAAGHSVGAWAALMVANGDPLRRFRAAVALDSYHGFDFGVTGTEPTLLVQSEQENVLGPRLVAPSSPRSPHQLHPTRAVFSALRARGVDTGFFVLRGSTHADFSDSFVQASRRGQRVATYLSLAWLDAHLRDGARARSGRRRLHAERFDRSADVSSIGTGTYDPSSGRNVPYAIDGSPVAAHLSFYYPSDLFDGGRACLDLRVRACPRRHPY
jgi:dienelactone hydrolase